LDAVEFLRRFLLHVLPRGFQRIRHYGFLANGVRQVKLPLCRRVLGQALRPAGDVSPVSVPATATSRSWSPSEVCPACHVGQMQVRETWFPQRTRADGARPLLVFDTS
jgi:hypothetical protein